MLLRGVVRLEQNYPKTTQASRRHATWVERTKRGHFLFIGQSPPPNKKNKKIAQTFWPNYSKNLLHQTPDRPPVQKTTSLGCPMGGRPLMVLDGLTEQHTH